MTDWTDPENVTRAKQAAQTLRSMQLLSAAMQEQIDGMADFYHREFIRRQKAEQHARQQVD